MSWRNYGIPPTGSDDIFHSEASVCRHETEDGEDDESSEEACPAVNQGNDDGISETRKRILERDLGFRERDFGVQNEIWGLQNETGRGRKRLLDIIWSLNRN